MLGQRHLCCQGNYAVADAPYFLQRRFRVGGFWQCCRWEQRCTRCSLWQCCITGAHSAVLHYRCSLWQCCITGAHSGSAALQVLTLQCCITGAHSGSAALQVLTLAVLHYRCSLWQCCITGAHSGSAALQMLTLAVLHYRCSLCSAALQVLTLAVLHYRCSLWQCCRWEQHCARCSRAQSRKFLVQKEPFVVPLVAVFCGVSAASVPLLQQQHCQSPPTQSPCLTSAMPLLCSQDERPCVGNHVLADGAIIPIFLKQLVPRRLFPPRLCFG